jgi:hypothetical protein
MRPSGCAGERSALPGWRLIPVRRDAPDLDHRAASMPDADLAEWLIAFAAHDEPMKRAVADVPLAAWVPARDRVAALKVLAHCVDDDGHRGCERLQGWAGADPVPSAARTITIRKCLVDAHLGALSARVFVLHRQRSSRMDPDTSAELLYQQRTQRFHNANERIHP